MDNLEDLQEALDDESKLWEQNGMAMNMVQHSNDSLFILKQQSQAILNVLITNGLASEEDLNLEFKRILLNSMREIRADFEKSRKEAIGKMVQPGVALPEHRILGLDGKEIKL